MEVIVFMQKKEVVIADVSKKYDNPIAELVQVACRFNSTVNIVDGTHHINAKSIMGIMAFNPCKGKTVQLEADGEDEQSALDAMERYLLCE